MDDNLLLTLFVALFAITNPVGSLAIFAAMTTDRTDQERKKTAIHSCIAITIILIVVTWAGSAILSFFGISPSAFEVGGGLVIVLLGLSMMNGHNNSKSGHSSLQYDSKEHKEALEKDNVAVVPIAIPIVAGPGAITTIIIHTHALHSVGDKFAVSGICIILSVIIFLCFYFSSYITKIMGQSGMKIVTRIMGLIIIAIAFSMIAQGMLTLFPGLR